MAKLSLCHKIVRFFVRYIFGSFIIVPLAALFAPIYRLADAFTFDWFQGRFVITPAEHKARVKRVQDQVRAWVAAGGRTSGKPMCTAKPVWNSLSMRGINKSVLTGIQVDHLDAVVEVDEVNRTVTIEPGVMMGNLTAILLPRGWTIPVVPEFESLTVGGIVCGTGIESSSGRHGLNGDCALEYELVLASGSVVRCSATENEDLFYAVHWSHGTLGLLTAVKWPLIPAKKYVRTEYHVAESAAEARRLLETQDHEFVEGIAFGPKSFVVSYGDFADDADRNQDRGRVNSIGRWYKPCWYQIVRSKGRSNSKGKRGNSLQVDYIPTREYYHRHTRAYFWLTTPSLPLVGTRIFQILLGWVFPVKNLKVIKRILYAPIPKPVFDWAYNSVVGHSIVCQDFMVPIGALEDTLRFMHDAVEVYPIWLCPAKFFNRPGMAHARGPAETELFVDVGLYGETASPEKYDYVETNRKMEAYTIGQGGFQFLYADSFLSRAEFRKMFDMSTYDKAREKYGAIGAYPDVYDKVSKVARGFAGKDSDDSV